MTKNSLSQRTMVALDNMNKEQLHEFLAHLPLDFPWVKVGLEQYLTHGQDLVKIIHEKYQRRVFLDLKLHDIPNTVAKALKSLKDLPIEFVTVHLSGGRSMLSACQDVVGEYMPQISILGVSYLTSLGEEDFNEIWSLEKSQVNSAFERLFNLALTTNTQGVVCSAFELEVVKRCEQKAGKSLKKVCPGIRFKDEIGTAAVNDQRRVMSPQEADRAGADFLVMGRSITQALDIQARVKELSK